MNIDKLSNCLSYQNINIKGEGSMLEFIFTYQPIMCLALWCLLTPIALIMIAQNIETERVFISWTLYVLTMPFLGIVGYLIFVVPIGLFIDAVLKIF